MSTAVRAPAAWTGTSVPRKEDRRLLMGAGHFTDDHEAVDPLFCVIVRSTRPHARLLSVDTTPARSMPGVVSAISGTEALEHWSPMPATWEMEGVVRQPGSYAMATDRVRYVGEPVAAVVAETRAQAEDAAAAVRVAYEDLPVITTMADAVGEGLEEPRARLYDSWPDNRQCVWPFEIGDLDGAFAQADFVVRERISSQRYSTMPLETRAVSARFEPAERRLTVHASTQIPHQVRGNVARVFGLPEVNVRIVSADVGGGFGGKLALDSEYVPILMAVLTGRNVKWAETREEWIAAGAHARDFVMDVEAAFDADGRLLALRHHLMADMGCDGAERAGGLGMPIMAGTYMPGGYRLPNYSMNVECVVTNKAPYGACRGYGKDIANLGIERVLDQAARRLGIEPGEIRRRNLTDTYPHQLPTGPVVESGTLLEAVDKLEELIDLPGLRDRQRALREQGRYLGIGLVSFLEPCGGSIPNSMYQNAESATVRVAQDGSVRVYTGIQGVGQGIGTSMALVAADRLGCSPDQVHVTWGDTESVPFGFGAYSGRGAAYGVSAVVKAADAVREKVLIAAGQLLECSPEELVVEAGAIIHPGGVGGARSVTLADVAHAVYFHPGAQLMLPGVEDPALEARATWVHPSTNWNPDALGRVQLYTAHPGGAQAALVEVDVETGEVEVQRLWQVADHGAIIHPPSFEGQIVGGTIQQLGGTMLESIDYGADGQLQTRTLRDYGLPNIAMVPPVEVTHLYSDYDATPVGAKGVGEGGCIATTTSLLAAVEDALAPLGVKVMSSPLTPWRVLEMIDAARDGRRYDPRPMPEVPDAATH